MRFLIDNSLSPTLVGVLRAIGHEAEHVLDHGMQAEADAAIVARAIETGSVVVAADTDFGEIVMRSGLRRPSIILFRLYDNRPALIAALLRSHLPTLIEHLETPSIVVFDDAGIRIHRLT